MTGFLSSAETAAKNATNNISKQISTLSKTTSKKDSLDNTATPFSDQYEVSSSSYPIDLMDSTGKYGGSFVVFYINVAEDSKLVANSKPSEFVPDNTTVQSSRYRGDLIANNIGLGKLTTYSAVSNAATGGFLSGLFSGGKSAADAAAGAAAGAVGAGAVGAIATSASRQQRRLKKAIALHIPNNLSVRYGVSWEGEDTLMMAMMANGMNDAIKAAESGDSKNLSQTAAAIVSNLALSKSPAGSAMSAATGLAANPKKEQIFKGVDYRTFQFEYQFYPRNSAEAANVLDIIKTFKYHMHPEFKDDNNFIYIYPSEFDISYYTNGQVNKNIHQHTSCVLTELNINYTPNGAFTTFADGMPTQINVTMQFKELALLTKDKIEAGL